MKTKQQRTFMNAGNLKFKLPALLLFVLISLISYGQQHNFTGKVTGSDGNPLPGVNIQIKGTDQGGITDVSGNFTVSADAQSVVLVFSYIGFITEEVDAMAGTAIEVTLMEDVTGLEEIVVIGYGIQKRRLVTGAISSIDAKDIGNTPVQRAEQALQGKTAGVFVLPESGAPGSGMKVRIRGAGSNGQSNPLYVVDGIKYTDINFLDPNDIESLEVLKDAASSAIYGAEGANGVVIITTKSGKPGATQVSYDLQYGFQSAPVLPELMSGDEYLTYMNEAGHLTDSAMNSQRALGHNTDWLNEIIQTAPLQKHNLSFSGGDEKVVYNTSLSYLNQDGIIGGTDAKFERFTGRINTTYQMKDWLRVGGSIAYSSSKRASIQEDTEFAGVVSSALYIDPATPTTYAPGSLPNYMQSGGEPIEYLRTDDDGNYYALSQNISGEIVNPLLLLDIERGERQTDNMFGNIFAELTPFKGFTFTTRAGVDYIHEDYKYWTPRYYYSAERNNSTLTVLEENFTHKKWQWENFATYQTKINQHGISITAGMSAEQVQRRVLEVTSGAMPYEEEIFAQHNATSGLGDITDGSTYNEKLVSYFGRVSYDYDNKYMIQATLRNDAASSSLVHPDNKWGTFPSVSAGWNLSEEDFWTVDVVNHFKLRGSWGQNGNLANLRGTWTDYDDYSPFRGVKPFLYVPALSGEYIRYPLPDGTFITGVEPQNLANDELTWETSEQTNFGVDLRLLKNRFSLSMDYYIKKTIDLIALYGAPAVAGNSAPFVNSGTVENKGFEFDLGYKNNDGELKYSVNVNFATLNNEVTEFTATVPRINGRRVGINWNDVTVMEQGYPLWYFHGYKTESIGSDGLPVYEDVDGDGSITEEDKTLIGDPHPDLLYGASVRLEYKGLDFNMFMQGSMGNDILIGWIRSDRSTGNLPKVFYDERGGEFPGANTITNADNAGRIFQSDALVFDGSYLRIKQIQVGYTLPSSIAESIKFTRARVYVSLDDYFTFTKYPGIDPEAGSTDDASLGIDRGMYPVPRKLMLGLSVAF